MGVAGIIFEPHPPNFENLYNFWRCLNGIKIIFGPFYFETALDTIQDFSIA